METANGKLGVPQAAEMRPPSSSPIPPSAVGWCRWVPPCSYHFIDAALPLRNNALVSTPHISG